MNIGFRHRPGALLFCGLLCATAAPAAAQHPLDALRPALESRIAAHHGKVGLAVIDLASGDSLVLGEDAFPSASVIKVPVLIQLFHEVDRGRVGLGDPLTLIGIDKVPGSGILQHLSTPHQLTVEDAATLMIMLSDNTATNLLIDKLGIRAVNARMDTLGFAQSRLHAEVFGRSTTSIDMAASERFGLGVTTPLELARMFEGLYRGTIVSPAASAKMIEILKLQASHDRIPRYLGDVVVAHKTGEVNESRHDCGIVYAEGHDYVICIMTDENEDQSWRLENEATLLGAELARMVHRALVPESGS